MAYINFQNCTKQEYDNKIYGQNDVNSCKLYFNNVELQDADNYLEKITFKKRVLPENGKKVFGLDNFIAEEVEIIIHDINTSIIQDKVRIELGTLVNNTYEYVPMGVYNIQDTPTRNDDKITIKLRDNAVLFDFNYNAKPLIDSLGGSATKMQILQDICNQANVTCGVSSFLGDSDLIGTYDNTIKGRMYVAYLAEQAGCIAKIDRNGELIFIPLNNLYTQRIPLSVVSKYVKGTTYTIQRLVYELGTIKFETSSDETLQTLYISSLNPYISTQEQIEDIFDIVGGYEVDTVEILSDIIGNPSIDGYDMIQVYDDESENDAVVFTTLANNTLTYNGKFKSKYKTEIGLEERKENVTNTGEAVFQKTITSEVDRLNGVITTEVENNILNPNNPNSVVSQMTSIKQDYAEIKAQISDIADITTSAEDTDAQIELENINASEPITIKIHPVNENISYLYPNSELFPSPTTYLKIRKIRFHNNTTDENFDYILPEDLLYYDSENYDEFLLDYGDGTSETKICQVTKKCKYNVDGSVSLLTTPEIHDYSNQYPTIDLTNGDYLISLLGYSTGYVFARLMASNIYTTQFSTKVETNALIQAKAGEINLEVNQKLDKSDFNSANIVLAINGDGTSSASINANKININGVITAINNNTSTTINGNKITTGTITASQISANAITAEKIQAGSINSSKVASDIITTTNFNAQNINASNITSGTLNVDRINAKSITADKIEDKGITNTKIADSTITNTQIANNTISSEKINNINADKITAGTINASNVSIINLNANNIKTGSINSSNGITIGGFSIGNYSFSGSTSRGTMTIQRGSNASIDFPANGGRLMLGSSAGNGVALTTASSLVISDNYSHTGTGDSNSSIGIRAIYGSIRLATNYSIKLETSGNLIIDGHTGQSIDRIIYKDSNGNNKYMIFYKGILIGYN